MPRLRLLHKEGAAIALNLSQYLNPIKSAMKTALQWQREHTPLLKRLGIDVSVQEEEEGESDSVVSSSQEKQHYNSKVSFDELLKAKEQGSRLVCSIESYK